MSAKFVAPARRFQGSLRIPGDKSISHRAAILGLLAEGETRITNFLTADDCLNTLAACQALGARVRRDGAEVRLQGRGLQGLQAPPGIIDCGNSGTGVRLLAGVLAGQPFSATLTGDDQVRRRPMRRVIEPLTRMGARIESEPGGYCPIRIQGGPLRAIDYVSPIASAQVKSCLLLAGLLASGETSITEPTLSRDHTERLLEHFGVRVRNEIVDRTPDERNAATWGTKLSVQGGSRLTAQEVVIPADVSSAAFFIVAALLLPGSELLLPGLGVNPTRTGLLQILKVDLGADLTLENLRDQSGEKVADLRVRGQGNFGRHQLVIDNPEVIPTLIDEIPILAVAATAVQGRIEIRRADELRVKETDRIHVLAVELAKIGVDIRERKDGLLIRGGKIRGGQADSHGDHRLAMSLAVAGLVSEQGVTVERAECVTTSFPEFWDLLAQATA